MSQMEVNKRIILITTKNSLWDKTFNPYRNCNTLSFLKIVFPFFAFACNAKSFVFAIRFSFFLLPSADFGRTMLFFYCYLRRVLPISDLLA